MNKKTYIRKAIADARVEVKRQLEKYREQDYPCLDQSIIKNGHYGGFRMCESYNISNEKQAKSTTDIKAQFGNLTWVDIALEELCEAVSEFDAEKLYIEVIQLAAVCLSWAAKIQRIDLKK